jgi:hypothetical protein
MAKGSKIPMDTSSGARHQRDGEGFEEFEGFEPYFEENVKQAPGAERC